MKLEELLDPQELQRAAEGAARFERNEFMERLIVLRETKPKVFASLSSPAKTSLAWYEAGKRRAEMLHDR
jgi:hypothetical protein